MPGRWAVPPHLPQCALTLWIIMLTFCLIVKKLIQLDQLTNTVTMIKLLYVRKKFAYLTILIKQFQLWICLFFSQPVVDQSHPSINPLLSIARWELVTCVIWKSSFEQLKFLTFLFLVISLWILNSFHPIWLHCFQL